MAELGQFIIAIWRHWLGKISGVFGLTWTVALLFFPGAPAWTFGVLCVVAFAVACFQAWRDEYLAARPYERETLRHAKEVFDKLPSVFKATLDQLAIEKIVPPGESGGILWQLEKTGFVRRDYVTANYSLTSEYEYIIPRLAKEWRSSLAATALAEWKSAAAATR